MVKILSDSWEMATPFQRDREAFLLTMWKMLIVYAETSATVLSLFDVYSLKTSPLWRLLLPRLAKPVSVSPLHALTPCLSLNKHASLCSAAACNNLTSLFSCIPQACWTSSVRWLLSQIIPPTRSQLYCGSVCLCVGGFFTTSPLQTGLSPEARWRWKHHWHKKGKRKNTASLDTHYLKESVPIH